MILVTGGTGFLGSHLLACLMQAEEPVRVLKRPTSSLDLLKRVFSYYTSDVEKFVGRIEWIDGDLTDIFSLQEAMHGCSKIYHCGAIVTFATADKARIMKVNAEGTANLVNAALEEGIAKICHVSSIASLGSSENGANITEDSIWKSSRRHSAYSKSKYAAEQEIWRGVAEGLNAVVINPSVIIGPGDWESSIAKLFVMIKGGLSYFTGGANGYVDVRDVADCMIRLMESEICNERFVVNSANLSYKELLRNIAFHLNCPQPARKAGRLITALAWRFSIVRGFIVGKKPSFTRETARISQKNSRYSNKKIRDKLNYSFRPITESIIYTAGKFLAEKPSG